MSAGWDAAPAPVPRKHEPGAPRAAVRPHYEGLPFDGLDEGRTNAGESLRDQGERMLPVRTRKHGPGAEEAAAVKRRKARRPASSAGVSEASETGPAARRATGAAFRTSASRRFTPSTGDRDPGEPRARFKQQGRGSIGFAGCLTIESALAEARGARLGPQWARPRANHATQKDAELPCPSTYSSTAH
jgi:hypothetical protein